MLFLSCLIYENTKGKTQNQGPCSFIAVSLDCGYRNRAIMEEPGTILAKEHSTNTQNSKQSLLIATATLSLKSIFRFLYSGNEVDRGTSPDYKACC
jgi:hypothetical protein